MKNKNEVTKNLLLGCTVLRRVPRAPRRRASPSSPTWRLASRPFSCTIPPSHTSPREKSTSHETRRLIPQGRQQSTAVASRQPASRSHWAAVDAGGFQILLSGCVQITSHHAVLRAHLHESIIFINFYSRTAYSKRLIKQDTVLYICMDPRKTA